MADEVSVVVAGETITGDMIAEVLECSREPVEKLGINPSGYREFQPGPETVIGVRLKDGRILREARIDPNWKPEYCTGWQP